MCFSTLDSRVATHFSQPEVHPQAKRYAPIFSLDLTLSASARTNHRSIDRYAVHAAQSLPTDRRLIGVEICKNGHQAQPADPEEPFPQGLAGKKKSRRNARVAKAAQVAPRPVDLLRPVVRCPTIKYNRRVRPGRGFSLVELKGTALLRLHPGIN
ncbi:hypothetical protein OPT61_g10664 [Boeremia exigua]|uniref:Uncharacterized protein n=1 Tax=Boeremia exigua TaxID=749465 RepID=A0ACC2HNK9_9PLEO|nr:hypothetical protein OPT61_g10664 [Boeremia exigua]